MKQPPARPRKALAAGSPFLTHVALREEHVEASGHPFDLPILAAGLDLAFSTPVTFLVGENGSGKSTLLEALAWGAGFASQGGSRDHRYAENDDGQALGRALLLSWRQKVTSGFFLRAETFFNFATYLEQSGSTFSAYGDRSLHAQSHGEAFLALFNHRFEGGLYILDEPEAALSPQRQLAFLGILHSLATPRIAQFVIATHSPMLLAFPGATVLSFDDGRIAPIDYRETDHFQLMKSFLDSPERFFRHLFDAADSEPQGEAPAQSTTNTP
jgi:predicted ATPase